MIGNVNRDNKLYKRLVLYQNVSISFVWSFKSTNCISRDLVPLYKLEAP